MEVHSTDALGRPVRLPERKKGAADRAGNAAGSSGPTDRVSLSRKAVAYLEEQAKRAQEAAEQEMRRAQGEQTGTDDGGMLDALDKSLKEMKRCQEIARRIMAGDRVPPEDEQYLMEHDENGYKLAQACKKEKKDPKEWESLLKDEKEQGAEGAEGVSSPEPPVEAAEPAPDGGRADGG